MKKLQLLCVSSLLVAGIAQASHAATVAPACSGFELKLKNNLTEDLVVTNVILDGADIAPGGVQKIDSHAEQVFTINNSNTGAPMSGQFTLRTVSLPSKTVKIAYTLENKGIICEHKEIDAGSEVPVGKTRNLNQVLYTINP